MYMFQGFGGIPINRERLINWVCGILCKLLQSKGQATLAQLVERLIRNQQVAGSIPAGGSSYLVRNQSVTGTHAD
jgi:hypothetical protein